jgi:hypothetical protein
MHEITRSKTLCLADSVKNAVILSDPERGEGESKDLRSLFAFTFSRVNRIEPTSTRVAFVQPAGRAPNKGGTRMQTTHQQLHPAQAEVQRTAHDQDLVEVPKRAKLDREAEGKKFHQPPPARAEE